MKKTTKYILGAIAGVSLIAGANTTETNLQNDDIVFDQSYIEEVSTPKENIEELTSGEIVEIKTSNETDKIDNINEEIPEKIESNTQSLSIDNSTKNENISITVYKTSNGNKYHRSNCQYVKKSKVAINKDDAISAGLTACSKCNP